MKLSVTFIETIVENFNASKTKVITVKNGLVSDKDYGFSFNLKKIVLRSNFNFSKIDYDTI